MNTNTLKIKRLKDKIAKLTKLPKTYATGHDIGYLEGKLEEITISADIKNDTDIGCIELQNKLGIAIKALTLISETGNFDSRSIASYHLKEIRK